MLASDESPIIRTLKWRDVNEGSFWFKKIPQGLARNRPSQM